MKPMADVTNTTRFRFWLWLIALVGVIVPRRLRADWRQEWEAELRYREELLSEWDHLNWKTKFDLLRRSLGSFRDALLLQPRRLEDEMFQDLRFGVRMLRKNPGFATIAVMTLALGIGINAAIFSVVDGVLLRPLPYPNADQLVRIWSANPSTGQRYLETSYQDFQQFKQQSHAFARMAAFSVAPRILSDDRQEPSHITVARVTDGFLSVLGVAPMLGRDFLPEENEHSGRSVILSDRLWRNRYAANPAILGRTVMIDGEPHTVVGVMPQGTGYPRTADLWRPLSEEEKQDDDPELLIIGRLQPGVTMDQSAVEVSTIARQIAETAP